MTGHVIVVDLGYGDAGKGGVVDWLCARQTSQTSQASTVVRFNGGAQAAHHVLAPGGGVHAFAQFGSGTFTPGVRTFLSRFMLVDPLAMTAEAAHLQTLHIPDPFGLVTVDRDALLTTPYHRAANRARELAREANRHGSCGMGIGETARYALDHRNRRATRRGLRNAARPDAQAHAAPRPAGRTNQDAAQSRHHPFWLTCTRRGRGGSRWPRTATWQPCSARGPWCSREPRACSWMSGTASTRTRRGPRRRSRTRETLLAEAGETATRLGVIRCYLTRHGPGPFVTEDPAPRPKRIA